jgi:membrane peptidoglycan carboxypeptidase
MGAMLFPLNEIAQVVLDGSGNGTVTMGPTNAFQCWKPSNAACAVSTNVKEPTFTLYSGRAGSNANRYGGTYTGSNDNTDISGMVLYPGSVVTGVWTGGDVGGLATLTLSGDVERYP